MHRVTYETKRNDANTYLFGVRQCRHVRMNMNNSNESNIFSMNNEKYHERVSYARLMSIGCCSFIAAHVQCVRLVEKPLNVSLSLKHSTNRHTVFDKILTDISAEITNDESTVAKLQQFIEHIEQAMKCISDSMTERSRTTNTTDPSVSAPLSSSFDDSSESFR
jgi:hypothetical protein